MGLPTAPWKANVRCGLSVVLWVACIALGALRAQAQAPAPEQEPPGYRDLIERAIAADAAGKREEARSLFGQAHALYPNARTFRGLGMVEFELGNYTASADVLQRALTSGVKPLEGKLRTETEQLLAKAHGSIGRYSVVTQPAQSSIWLDGKPPLYNALGELLVPRGRHQLQVSAPGHRTEERLLQVKGGEHETLQIALLPEAAPMVTPVPPPGTSVPAPPPQQPAAPPPPTYAWPTPEREDTRRPESLEQAPSRAYFRGNDRVHQGFMLRFELGLGYTAMSADVQPSFTMSGLSGMFAVDIGGTLADNLALHLRLSAISVTSPRVKIGNMTYSTTSDAVASSLLLAPALTYYIMPANVYLTGAIGASWMRLETDNVEAESDLGLGLNFDVGKEWWIGDDWGLGVGGQFWYSKVSDSDGGGSVDLTSTGFTVFASATLL